MWASGAGAEETDVRYVATDTYPATDPEETEEEVRAAVRKAWGAQGDEAGVTRRQTSVPADQMDWFW